MNAPPWKESEDEYLRENYRHRSHRRMAEQLGRSPAAVNMRCMALGLKLTRQERAKRISDSYWRKGSVL